MWDGDVIELQLAHLDESSVKAIYNRTGPLSRLIGSARQAVAALGRPDRHLGRRQQRGADQGTCPQGTNDMKKLTLEQKRDAAKSAVVRVGDGRGFIVSAGEYDRYVVTAAHCIPHTRFPRPHLANSTNELTFPKFIGPLGSARKARTIWGELCVTNLNDDVAVFQEPDGQDLHDEWTKYEKFTKAAVRIGRPPSPPISWKDDPALMDAFVLSLDGEWQSCAVQSGGGNSY